MTRGINWQKLSSEFRGKAQSLGICLEPSQLTLVHIQKNFRSLDLKHLVSWRIPETGLAALKLKVEQTVSELELAELPVVLTVKHGPGFIKPINLPIAAKENLAQVVAYELDRFIPVTPEHVWFNFQIDHKTDTDIHLILFAVHKKPVQECLALLDDAGLKPLAVELAPVSCANAFAFFDKRLPASWILLDTAAGVTDLYQINRGKLRYSLHKVYRSTDEMWSHLVECLASVRESSSPAGAICQIGDAMPPKIGQALDEINGLILVPEADLLAEKFSSDFPVTSGVWPALGAALQGVAQVPVVCNLLPPEARGTISLRNTLLMRTLLVSFLSLALIWAGSIFFRERVALYQVDNKIKKLSVAVDQVKHQRGETEAIRRQLQELWGGKYPAVSKLKILNLLTSTIPDHTWLYSLRINTKQLEISGMSKSAADVIQLLEKSGLFTKTQFSSPIVNDAGGNENFTIQAEFKELD